MINNEYDVVVLTEDRYANPKVLNDYVKNVVVEDALLLNALEKCGMRSARFSWSDKEVNWSKVRSVIFSTTWDYFDRYDEFKKWFEHLKSKVVMYNDPRILEWNQDKIYLSELKNKGIEIPETIFIKKGDSAKLIGHAQKLSTEEFVLKPNVSGAARHTYRLNRSTCDSFETNYRKLIEQEDFMIQAFQFNILTKGEISLVLIGGEFTHSVLKRGKGDDFRVQDDFGGTVDVYTPNLSEIDFAKICYDALDVKPMYCRVDLIWNNNGELALSELEMIEPELWFRNEPEAAMKLAKLVAQDLSINR